MSSEEVSRPSRVLHRVRVYGSHKVYVCSWGIFGNKLVTFIYMKIYIFASKTVLGFIVSLYVCFKIAILYNDNTNYYCFTT